MYVFKIERIILFEINLKFKISTITSVLDYKKKIFYIIETN